MSVTQKPLPGADSQHFVAISYPLDWEKTLFYRVTTPAEKSAWEYLGGEPCVRCGLGLREIEKEGR